MSRRPTHGRVPVGEIPLVDVVEVVKVEPVVVAVDASLDEPYR